MATRARHVSGPKRGDVSRTALLGALDELLATKPLAEIGIADITRTAGLTRSAFYFYFPSKAAAVAALLADFYEEMLDAAEEWYEGGPGSPGERLRAGFEASVSLWRERAGLMVAMLDAVGTDADVRAIWTEWVDGFVGRVAARIAEERAAGVSTGVIAPPALAAVLVGAAFAAMERDVRAIRAGRSPSDGVTEALVGVWQRSLYGPRTANLGE
jgi:AcrR family transcriptional regulator